MSELVLERYKPLLAKAREAIRSDINVVIDTSNEANKIRDKKAARLAKTVERAGAKAV